MNTTLSAGLSCGLVVLALVGCRSDEPRTFTGGEFELRFAGVVGDEPFACGETYSGLGKDGAMAMAQDLRFYVSDVRLIDNHGEEVPVELASRDRWQTPDVALIDFEDGTSACETSGNAPTNNRITATAPPGDYVGVVFSLGVPEALNHEDPTQAPAPLQVTAMQWNWLLGYKFMRAEVKPMMHEESGTGGASGHEHSGGSHSAEMGGAHHLGGAGAMAGASAMGGMAGHGTGGTGGEHPAGHALDSQFHLGSLSCTNEGGDAMGPPAESCARPNRSQIRLERFHPERELVAVDLAEIMKNIDLSVTNHCHGMPHDSCDDFYAAVGLDYESGEAGKGQTAFRVQDR